MQWWLFIAILGLSGCAQLPVTVVPQTLNPVALSAFELDGRIAVHYRENSVIALLHWQHSPAIDSLVLSSPLGQTFMLLNRDRNGVTLVDSEHKRYAAPTMSGLTEQMLGWRLPLEDLSDWIVGSVVPNQTYQLQAATAQSGIRLMQVGWTVSYDRWQPVAGLNLPARMTLSGQGVEIRLIISDWHLPRTP